MEAACRVPSGCGFRGTTQSPQAPRGGASPGVLPPPAGGGESTPCPGAADPCGPSPCPAVPHRPAPAPAGLPGKLGYGRVPAGAGPKAAGSALRLPPGRRRRLFRASWPRSGRARLRRPGCLPPAARRQPAPRAPRPLTCHRRRLAQHQPPSLPLRGQRERKRPPRPAPAPRPPRAPTFLPSRSLTWPSTSAASVIFCHGSRRARRAFPRRPAAAQPRVTFKIARGGRCAADGGRAGGGGARAGHLGPPAPAAWGSEGRPGRVWGGVLIPKQRKHPDHPGTRSKCVFNQPGFTLGPLSLPLSQGCPQTP